MTSYTSELKEKLRADIRYIDDQLELAQRRMEAGDKAEAWAILDGTLDYFDFKKHFPDIFVNEDETMRFQDMYEALRGIDDIVEIDAIDILTGRSPREWRPGYTRLRILQRLRDFLVQIETWLALNWFEGDAIRRALETLKEKIKAFIRFFENINPGQFLWGPVIEVRDAKKLLWRALSENLPFAEIYELLMSMDRDLTFLVFRFRLHLDELKPEEVAETIEDIVRFKHSILAIIDATRSDDKIVRPPASSPEGSGPLRAPPGWDDLQPFPPAGYAFFGGRLVPIQASRRTGLRIDVVTARDRRKLPFSGLIGFALGAVAAAVVIYLLFSANSPLD